MWNQRLGKAVLALTLCLSFATANKFAKTVDKLEESNRYKRLFSLFSIVTFKNEGCQSNGGTGVVRNGTCYTASECSEKAGTASGNCASGFGVCCLFIVQSVATTISENCTYLQNPSYPSVYSTTTALTYTIKKCSNDVCQVRLDFESFTIDGPTLTTEATGGACTDSFVVSGTSGLSSPVICGKNTGQHIYMEMGTGATDTATLAFTFATTSSTTRTWEIKATQIPCGASYKAPDGCLQNHIGLTGRFTTFNFLESTTKSHLLSQNYQICIRPEMGYCCVQYSLCSDDNSFSLDASNAASKIDTNCAKDYVGIDGVQATCNQGFGATVHSRFCGAIFNVEDAQANAMASICDCTAPFTVEIYTDTGDDGIDNTQRGICFEYMQIPCANN